MPTFEVMVEEVHDQTFEEIYHAYRHMYIQRFYEVEAEDENEAITLAEGGEGTILRTDVEYGDVVDSEYFDVGESLGEDYVETNVTIVQPRPQHRPQVGQRWGGSMANSPAYFIPTPTTTQREPDWEV